MPHPSNLPQSAQLGRAVGICETTSFSYGGLKRNAPEAHLEIDPIDDRRLALLLAAAERGELRVRRALPVHPHLPELQVELALSYEPLNASHMLIVRVQDHPSLLKTQNRFPDSQNSYTLSGGDAQWKRSPHNEFDIRALRSDNDDMRARQFLTLVARGVADQQW